jgi:hypothetical protein
MEMNVDKTKAMRLSRSLPPVTNYDRSTTTGECGIFQLLLNTITNYARCTRKIKSRIVMVKAPFSKKILFARKLDLNLRHKLIKYYIWSVALYGAETSTLQKVDQKYLESLKCSAQEGWKRSVGLIV